MKDSKSTYLLSLMAIFLSIIAISICYLVLTSDIIAKEHFPNQSRGWKVTFSNLLDVKLTGSAKEIARPIIENKSTVIKNFNVSFKNSGDSATYVFTIKNTGVMDAKISDIVFTDPKCYGSGSNAIKDSKLVCDNIEFSATYSSGRTIKKDDVLKRGDKENLNVTIRYVGQMPSDTVVVDDLSMSIIYIQK